MIQVSEWATTSAKTTCLSPTTITTLSLGRAAVLCPQGGLEEGSTDVSREGVGSGTWENKKGTGFRIKYFCLRLLEEEEIWRSVSEELEHIHCGMAELT